MFTPAARTRSQGFGQGLGGGVQGYGVRGCPTRSAAEDRDAVDLECEITVPGVDCQSAEAGPAQADIDRFGGALQSDGKSDVIERGLAVGMRPPQGDVGNFEVSAEGVGAGLEGDGMTLLSASGYDQRNRVDLLAAQGSEGGVDFDPTLGALDAGA